jgi:putative CocE/NonD family hydrolase
MERGVGNEALRQAIGWYDRHLKGIPGRVRTYPVDVFVMGRDEWRSYTAWPPRAVATCFYLQPGGGLAVDLPRPGETSQVDDADQYRYDPADPTPSLGGATFMNNAGSVDNRPVESRPDVLVYTSAPLETDLTVVGPVRLTLFVRSSRPYTDFYGRLCDVWPDGRSMNLCDGITRLEPGQGDLQPDGSLRLELNLWATANCFLRGHAIRLQVSSGAYPRFDRNLGTGEPAVEGTMMYAADQTIYRDAAHPSALVLPVIGAGEAGG